MKLKSLGVVHWANLDNRDYGFDDINLLAGGSGAGKTTMLDAIQTLLTVYRQGLYQFNPGQEETTQQSRTRETRTVESYVLGCDQGRYSRPRGATCYLIGCFEPQPEESSEPLTAVIGLSAYLDEAGNNRAAKLKDEKWMIIRGKHLSHDDFIIKHDSSLYVVELDKVVNHLKVKHLNLQLHLARTKEDYLCRLYGGFQGKASVSAHEALESAKAISRFMAYKGVKNIDDFVRNEILEKADLSKDIDDIANLMRNIHEMEGKAATVVEGIELIDNVRKQAAQHLGHCFEAARSEYHRAGIEMTETHQQWLDVKNRIAKTQEDCDNNEREEQAVSIALGQCEETLQLKLGLRMNSDVLREKDRLTTDMGREQSGFDEAREMASDALVQLNGLTQTRLYLSQSLDNDTNTLAGVADFSEVIRHLQAFEGEQAVEDDCRTLLQQGIGTVSDEFVQGTIHAACRVERLHQSLYEALGAQQDVLLTHAAKTQNKLERQQGELKTLQTKAAKLAENRVTYPPDVERALRAIGAQYSDADARVLCDQIDLKDPDWQLAVESYMGDARFSILVTPAREADALRLVKKNRLRATVIQGENAARHAATLRLPENSIVHLMRFTHRGAESYVKAQFGRVVQVHDEQALRFTPRGLMRDARASGGFRMFHRPVTEEDLVFGANARQQALKVIKEKTAALTEAIGTTTANAQQLQNWQKSLQLLAPVSISKHLEKIATNAQAWQYLQAQLLSLDTAEYDELERKIETLKTDIEVKKAQLKSLNKETGRLGSALGELRTRADSLYRNVERHEQAKETAEQHLNQLSRIWEPQPIEEVLVTLDNSIQSDASARLQFDNEQNLRNQIGSLNQIFRTTDEFNKAAVRGQVLLSEGLLATAERLKRGALGVVDYQNIANTLGEADGIFNLLQNDILADYRDKLLSFKQQFDETFVENLCTLILNKIHDGEQALRNLNNTLKKHRFGEERYRFAWQAIERFKEYSDFFREATASTKSQSQSQASLLDEGSLSESSVKIFVEIKELLLSDNPQKARAELRKIADYRNYYQYDIIKVIEDVRSKEPGVEKQKAQEVSLSKDATGSGGQLETPSYVIRCASLASTLKYHTRNHLCCVMIDESFSKMDELRCREVMKYLNDTHGLQIILAMPTTKATSFYNAVDKVYNVEKVRTDTPAGELSMQVVISENQMKREAVKRLWRQAEDQVRKDVGYQGELSFLNDLDE